MGAQPGSSPRNQTFDGALGSEDRTVPGLHQRGWGQVLQRDGSPWRHRAGLAIAVAQRVTGTGVPGLHGTRTRIVDDRWIVDRCPLGGAERPWAEQVVGIEAEEMGAGIPAIFESQPLAGEHMIEYVLIPMAQLIGIASGEFTPANKYISLAPSNEINEHHTSIEVLSIDVAVIAA